MKILIVYTGGTIGMIKDANTGALIPGEKNGIENFLMDEGLDNHCDLISTSSLIDSSDFNKEKYTELSLIIKNNYHSYDCFLILMGTDTMAYISSLLSFCISGLSKPILFTGGQKTLYEENSDSKKNLSQSIKGLLDHKFTNEVGIYFSNQWYRAVCTTKHHSKNFNAYVQVKNSTYTPVKNNEFDVMTTVTANVVILKITPFLDENVLLTFLENTKIDAMILEIFGSGNMPNLSTMLQNLFKKRIKQGLKVVISSQCMYGGLEIGRYASSLSVSSLGFLNGGNMTKEAIVGKLMFLVEKKLNIQDFCSMFEDSIRGE